jgi:hypothetical protein
MGGPKAKIAREAQTDAEDFVREASMTRVRAAEILLRKIYNEMGPKIINAKFSPAFRPAPLQEYIKNPHQWDFDHNELMLKVAKFLERG